MASPTELDSAIARLTAIAESLHAAAAAPDALFDLHGAGDRILDVLGSLPRAVREMACPTCGGPLQHKIKDDTITWRGLTKQVAVEARWCDRCGEAMLDGRAFAIREAAYDELDARASQAAEQ